MDDRFVARNSPVRLVLFLLCALGFVVLGLWVAGQFGAPPRPAREWFGWLAALFFGLCAVMIFRRLFDQREQIVVDRNGILWRQWSETTIPWMAIRDFESAAIRGLRFLCLYLHDPSRYPPSGMRGWLLGANKGMGFGDIAMSAMGTDRSFDEFFDAVDRFCPRSTPGA